MHTTARSDWYNVVALQDQQQAISAGLAGFVQPESSPELGQGTLNSGGDDEYDPEDADMQF